MSKLNKINLKIKVPKQKQEFNVERPKIDRTKELRKKIEEKYRKELPALKTFEVKFYCSIVLIQRLWRQRRIKRFISEFISPRSNPQCNITGDLLRESNSPRFDLTLTTEAQTSELIRKYHNVSFEKKREPIDTQMCSNELPTIERRIDLKDLELSSELTPEREIKIVKFVECLRDIAFLKPQQNKKKTRMNVFNLQESLS